jgi:uncharacterized protein (DUF302 family)
VAFARQSPENIGEGELGTSEPFALINEFGIWERCELIESKSTGTTRLRSHHSVDEAVETLQRTLQAKGIKIFCVIDHSGEAAKVGLEMPPTKLVIFGNPQSGTPLMLASPEIALDLPLKILVSEDQNGDVWVTYNTPEYLLERHSLGTDLLKNISGIDSLAAIAANE